MKSLFLPAINVMNRLGYPQKFALLALISLAAFSVVGYSLFVSLDKEISIARRELEGLGLISQAPKVIRLIQQHRGLSAGTLVVGIMRDERAINEKEIIEVFREMEGKLPLNLIESDAWQNIKANWQRLQGNGLDSIQAESFALHTRLINQLLLVESAIADEYGLNLDSEIDSYYLIDTTVNKLPNVIEYLGQLRAYGIISLANKRITEPEKISIVTTTSKLGDALKYFEISVGKAARDNPALQRDLLATSRNIADSVHQITGLVESDIMTGRFASSLKDFYVTTTTAIDANYSQMYGSLLSATGALLKARVARAENILYTSIGIALLLLLIVAYFAIGIYHSIIDSVRSLARSAYAFTNGDMRERVRLDVHDELGHIGDSFNEMADGFNAILVARKQAEESLQKSLSKQKEINQEMEDAQRHEVEALNELQMMLDTSGEGFWKVDPSGSIIKVNDAYCRLVGYARDEIIGAHISKFEAIEQTPEVVAAHIQHVVEQGYERFETKHRHCDGHLIDIEVNASFIPEKKCLIVFLHDVTERKLMEEKLRRSETKFRTVYESSSDGIMLLDEKGFLDCNDAALRVFGCSTRDDFINKHPAQFSPPTQPDGRDSMSLVNEYIATAFKNGSERFEWVHCRLNDTEFFANVWLTSMELNGRQMLQATVRDITARKKAEENLRKSNVELEAINQKLEEAHNQLMQSEKMASIGQLAAGVAHEINNPIGYVYSNLGTLEKYVQDTFNMIDLYEQAEGAIADAEVRTRLEAARKKLDFAFMKGDLCALMDESKDGITRVKKIVQNLKDFSHVDVSDEWHFSDLQNGLDSTLNIVNNEIKYKANVVKEYGGIPEVECLSSQLNQVFMNLLVNAAHAIEERGTITIRTGNRGEEVWVEVADTGKGIAPEYIKKIFDPFFTTKPIGKGTGLGLSLSYGIVQKHHGRIEVQSEVGKGTTFRVWLPVKQPQAENV